MHTSSYDQKCSTFDIWQRITSTMNNSLRMKHEQEWNCCRSNKGHSDANLLLCWEVFSTLKVIFMSRNTADYQLRLVQPAYWTSQHKLSTVDQLPYYPTVRRCYLFGMTGPVLYKINQLLPPALARGRAHVFIWGSMQTSPPDLVLTTRRPRAHRLILGFGIENEQCDSIPGWWARHTLAMLYKQSCIFCLFLKTVLTSSIPGTHTTHISAECLYEQEDETNFLPFFFFI